MPRGNIITAMTGQTGRKKDEEEQQARTSPVVKPNQQPQRYTDTATGGNRQAEQVYSSSAASASPQQTQRQRNPFEVLIDMVPDTPQVSGSVNYFQQQAAALEEAKPDTAPEAPKAPTFEGEKKESALDRFVKEMTGGQEPAEFIKEHGTEDPVRMQEQKINEALEQQDYETARTLLNELTASEMSASDRQQVTDYIDSLYQQGLVRGDTLLTNPRAAYRDKDEYMSQLSTADFSGNPQAQRAAEALKEAYDRDPRQFADLLESEEGQRYLGMIAAASGGTGKETDRQHNAYEQLRVGQETLKTRNATAAFQQRGTDEVARAQESGGVDENIMNRYLTAQGAVLALNDLYNQMDVGGNSETGRDVNSATNQYLIRELQQYGIDLSGMDESNFRELIESALEQQSRTAQATRDMLAQLGYDAEAVGDLLDYSRQVSYEQARQQAAQDFAEDRKQNHNLGTFLDDVALTAATIGENVWLSPLENISTWAQLGKGGSTNNPNEYTPVAGHSSNAALARAGVSGQMSGLGKFFYNALTSAADSAANVYSFGGAGSLAMMGANAATQTANDILQKGGSNEQAIVGGLAAGAIEILTEKFSVENLIKIKNGGAATVRALLENVGVNMLTEASEETAGAALDLIVDALNMGDQAESAQAVDEMVANGMSREEAVKQVWKDNLGDVLESAASGAVSGGVSAGVTGAATMIDNTVQQSRAREQALQNFEANLTKLYEQAAAAREQAAQADTSSVTADAVPPSPQGEGLAAAETQQTAENAAPVQRAMPAQTDVADQILQDAGVQGVSEERGTVSPVDTAPQTVTQQSQQAYEAADEARMYGPEQEQQPQETGITQYRAMDQYRGMEQTQASSPADPQNRRPGLPEGQRPSGKERQVIYNTMENSEVFGGVLQDVKAELENTDPGATVYDPISEMESMAEANERIHDDPQGETAQLMDREREWTGSDVDTAMGLTIMKMNEGDIAGAVQLAAEAARRGTTAGQMIQAYAKWSRTAVGAASKVVGEIMGDGTINSKRAQRLSEEVMRSAQQVQRLQEQQQQLLLEDGTPSRQRQQEIQRGYVDEILEMARIRNTVGTFSHEVSKAVQWALGKLDNQALHDIAVAQIRSAGADLTHRASLAEKAATAQALAQLSSLVTINRNLVGNFGFDLVDTISGNLGTVFDALFSTRTGQRTLAFDSGWFNSAKRQGAANGFLRSFAEVALDVNTEGIENRYGQTSSRTFKMSSDKVLDRFFSTWEKYSGYTLTSTDEFFKGGTRQSYLDRTQKFVDSGQMTAEDQARLADLEALERTFQQDSGVARGATSLKNALNQMLGFGGSSVLRDENGRPVRDANGKRVVLDRSRANDAEYIQEIAEKTHVGVKAVRDAMNDTTRFGLGNAMLNYPRVPSNLALLAFSYTPVGGAILSTYYTAKALQAGAYVTPEMQHKASLAVGRTLTGSALTAGFAALAKAGVLLVSGFSGDDEDKDRDAQRKAGGLSGTQLNISGLERWLQGEDPKPQDGDTLMSLAFLEPISGLMTVGALQAQAARDGDDERSFGEKAGDMAKYSMAGTLQTLYDMPVMEPFRNLYDNMRYSKAETEGEKLGEAALGLLGDLAAGFVPAPLKNIAKGSDPVYRETQFEDTGNAVGNAAARVWNQVRNNIPGLRQTLPAKTDAYGEEKTYNAGDALRWANSMALPGAVTGYRSTEINDEAERLHQTTGRSVFPSTSTPAHVKNSDGETVDLSKTQRTELREDRGQRYSRYAEELMQDERYKNATDDEKADMLQAAYSTANAQATEALGVGYQANDKINDLMSEGLSFADAYDVARWQSGAADGGDREVKEPRSAELWAYSAHLPGADALEETALTQEMRRVFTANGEKRYFAANAPDTVSNADGEKVELTDAQKQQFMDQRGVVFENLANELMADERYQNADDETKLGMLDKLYDLAGEAAKDALDVGYESSSKPYSLLQTGMSYADIWEAKAERDRVDEMVRESDNEDDTETHKLGMNAKAATFKAWVDNQDWTQDQKNAVLEEYGRFTSMSFSNTEKYDALVASGVTPDDAAALMRTLGSLQPEDGYTSVRPVQRWRAIADSNMTEEQKRAAMVYYLTDSQLEKFNTFLNSGLTVADYAKISDAKNTYGDGNGYWKKGELTSYLREQGYSAAECYWIAAAVYSGKNPYRASAAQEHETYSKPEETDGTSSAAAAAPSPQGEGNGAAASAGATETGGITDAQGRQIPAEDQDAVERALARYQNGRLLTFEEWTLLNQYGLLG